MLGFTSFSKYFRRARKRREVWRIRGKERKRGEIDTRSKKLDLMSHVLHEMQKYKKNDKIQFRFLT